VRYLLTLLFCASAFGADIGEKNVTGGLLGRWITPGRQGANGTAPSLAFDDSPFAEAGTITGAVTQRVVSSRAALLFGGGLQYLSLADNDRYTFARGGSDLPFTVAFWLRQTSTTGNQWVFTKRGETTQTEYQIVMVSGAPYINLFSGGGASSYYIGKGATTGAAANIWQHLVITYSGSKASSGIKWYRNGAPVALAESSNTPYTGMTNGTSQLVLATQSCGLGASSLLGYLERVHILDYALSNTEVAALYKRELR
jgi:hypothetical protein